MKTLYVRIIATMIIIMIVSSLSSFVIANLYYHHALKHENDAKNTEIAQNIVSTYEAMDGKENIDTYLNSMAGLGYFLYLHSADGTGQTYGGEFRKNTLSDEDIKLVLNGETYHGLKKFPRHIFITGFFNNDLMNSIGVPIEVDGETKALFVRQDTVHQFGEIRIFLAIILVLIIISSLLLVLLSTRYIVKPIRNLTEATRKIATGNYHVKLNVKRKDEIGRLANDFSQMSNSLAKNEEKRQNFVSNVSHEIQSPLTSIQGFSQALREEGLTAEERERYLSIIEKESKRLSALSKQLLTLSFLDSDIEQEQMVTYQVAEQIKDVVATLEWQCAEKDIDILVNVPELSLNGDVKLMYQVWLNLITNAIRYTDKQGSIYVYAEEKANKVDISVRDTGIGIAKEDLPHIFDRFYKVDKARTRTDKSTGLGLAIVKKIIELHDGTISVNSELDKGTTFTVTLPK